MNILAARPVANDDERSREERERWRRRVDGEEGTGQAEDGRWTRSGGRSVHLRRVSSPARACTRGKETTREQSDTRNPILPTQHFDRLLVQSRRRLCASVRYGPKATLADDPLPLLRSFSPADGGLRDQFAPRANKRRDGRDHLRPRERGLRAGQEGGTVARTLYADCNLIWCGGRD